MLFAWLIALLYFLFSSIGLTQNALTADDFLDEPDVFDAEFSPDGRYLAMIVKNDNRRVLIIRDYETKGHPITGTMGERFIRPSSISWANNERLIVNLLVPANISVARLQREQKKDPDFDINDYYMLRRSISTDVSAQDIVFLMNNGVKFKNNRNLSRINNFLRNDKEHIIMPAWGRFRYELLKVNVYTGHAEKITDGSRRTYEFITDENGNPTYRLDYYYYRKVIRIFEYTDDDDWEEIEEISLNQDDEESINNQGLLRFGFGDNNELIYRERNLETGFYEIVRRKRGSKEKSVIAALPNKDIHSPIYDSRTGKYLGFRTQEDLLKSHYESKDRQLHYDKIAQQIKYSNFYIWASREQQKRSVVKSYSADDPGTFFIYNYKNNKLTYLSDTRKKLTPEKLALPAKVFFKARDGKKIRLYILFPPNYKEEKKYPMVILPHGGPHLRDSSDYDRLAQFISTRGYIVIQPNFRGSSGYGLAFEKAGYRQWGQVMQDDLTDAVNFMLKQGYADSDRVCIVGGSYGGYAALMGAVKTPDLYQCSISINGVSHLKEQIEHFIDKASHNEEKVEDYVYKTIGHPDKDSEMLDNNSPALKAKLIDIPILIIAGEDDETVSVEQSEMMVEELEDNEKEHEYFELKDAGHDIFYYREDAKKVYAEIERFLAKHLKAKPSTHKAN